MIFCCLQTGFITALDVSFIPNDENAPLPLSTKYRESLRRLCVLLKSGSKLPSELVAKRKSLSALCTKLEADDKNIAGASRPSHFAIFVSNNIRRLLYSILGLGGGIFIWFRRQWIFNTRRDRLNSIEEEKPLETTAALQEREEQRKLEIQEAREARLKRFASINIQSEDLNDRRSE